MRFGRRNRTTWANKDARLDPSGFLRRDINRGITIRELVGGAAPNDFLGYVATVSDGARWKYARTTGFTDHAPHRSQSWYYDWPDFETVNLRKTERRQPELKLQG